LERLLLQNTATKAIVDKNANLPGPSVKFIQPADSQTAISYESHVIEIAK
jgi:hypothetical protein